MKGIRRLLLIGGEECSLMKQITNKAQQKCCMLPSQTTITSRDCLDLRRRSSQQELTACLYRVEGGDFIKCCRMLFFCSCFLSWDTKHKQRWGDWSKDEIYPGRTVPPSRLPDFTTSFRMEMNFNEASKNDFREMLLRLSWTPVCNITWTVTWPFWFQK